MTTNTPSQSHAAVWSPAWKFGLAAVLAVQLAIAVVVGSGHLLANDSQSFFAPIAMTATLPVALFLAAYALIPRFRAFVLAQDIRRLTMLQHWRVVGFLFLALYAFNVLPGLFAWPAGVGDVAIGLAATFIVARLDRDPDFALSRTFLSFNLLGLLDFAVAIVTAGLAAGSFPALAASGLTSAPMDIWPLNIFPSFIVPAFIILHLTVLLKVRALRRGVSTAAGQGFAAA